MTIIFLIAGIGLSDSPAALAGYVLEKFSYGTNPSYQSRDDGGIYEKFTLDTLIDNLMMYWISNSMTTSMRLYAESLNSFSRLSDLSYVILNFISFAKIYKLSIFQVAYQSTHCLCAISTRVILLSSKIASRQIPQSSPGDEDASRRTFSCTRRTKTLVR